MGDICSSSAWDILRDVSHLALPPERLTVPESSARNVVLDVKGGYYGEWRNESAPLMVEPAECLTSREYDSVIMVAPAQTGKTQALVDNWAFHTIACDPVDFLIVEKAETEARSHSKTKIDRTLSASPNLKAMMATGRGDNVHEKLTKSGAYLWIKWPTKNTLSGATISRIALTDYDRMPPDIDGEGPAFDLAYSRRTYFGSRGMVLAESSPSRPLIDPLWTPSSPHEAPPTTGILGLYNTGDRRRVYGRCPHCDSMFSPAASPDALILPDIDTADEGEIIDQAAILCTECGSGIGYESEQAFRGSGIWVREGQTINDDGTLGDDGRRSRRASFWMSGWFAAFANWKFIISEYVLAYRQFRRTGDEEPLKGAVNTKIGGPYVTVADRAAAEGKRAMDTHQRTEWDRYHVPDWARVITAHVDVQKRSFEVAIIARGRNNERWIMERFSLRKTESGDNIRPAIHVEHWEEITRRVVTATYRLPHDMELRVFRVCIDSGGEAGATERAYAYWRSLTPEHRRRVLLVKGVATHQGRGLSFLTRPDSRGRKNRPTGGRGDVPVLEIASNRAKDAVFADLQREIPGMGFIHIPPWLPDAIVRELQSEVRDAKGKWTKIGARRNELWDHLYYEHGLWDHLTRGDNVSFDRPPPWLAPWDRNSEVVSRKQRKTMQSAPAPKPRPARKNWVGGWRR